MSSPIALTLTLKLKCYFKLIDVMKGCFTFILYKSSILAFTLKDIKNENESHFEIDPAIVNLQGMSTTIILGLYGL
jgi:hypothetical protein